MYMPDSCSLFPDYANSDTITVSAFLQIDSKLKHNGKV